MSFVKFLPVALMVGVTAAAYLFAGAQLGIVLWVPFLTWALFYATGPSHAMRMKRLSRNILGAVGGTFFAAVFILLIPVLTSWGLSFPVTVAVLGFFAGTLIILLELTSWLEYATAYFVAFAGYFAYAFGAGQAQLGGYSPDNVALSVGSYILLLLLGYALGVITGWLRDVILSAAKVPMESRETVFDTPKTRV